MPLHCNYTCGESQIYYYSITSAFCSPSLPVSLSLFNPIFLFHSISGYWPSYNIPFHEKIYNWSGYPLLVQKLGLDYSYDLAPRAKIFRRDHGKVTDVTSMKYIMRYNSMYHISQEPFFKTPFLPPWNNNLCKFIILF